MAEQKQSGWGGVRKPGPGKNLGRPAKPKDEKREKHSPTLAPGTKALCEAIAKERGYPGWGYAIDEAIRDLANRLGIT